MFDIYTYNFLEKHIASEYEVFKYSFTRKKNEKLKIWIR